MKKSNHSTGRHRRVIRAFKYCASGEVVARVRLRWALVGGAALVCWILLAVRNGAEQVDSGWAVATPSPIATGATPINPDQQLVIRHVLEQTQQSLLRKPAAGQTEPNRPAKSTADKSGDKARVAAKSEVKDGWRSAGQSAVLSGPDHTVHLGKPQPVAITPLKAGDETDCDCSGNIAGNTTTLQQPEEPAQLPAVAGTNAPQPKLPASLIENRPLNSAVTEPSDVTATEPSLDDANGATPKDSVDAQTNEVAADPPPGVESKPAPQVASSKPAAKTPSPDIAPVNEQPPLTRQLQSLRTRVRTVLKGYYRKPLNSREHDPWEAMHGMLAYGVHSRIHQGGPNGDLITSVGWLCYNKPCKGQTLLYVTPSGELRAKYGVGLQGHLGQFLAMLAQCHVSPDYPIKVGNREFTIRDLIEAEKRTCYPKSELTFKLLALQHYADLDEKWVNDQGVEWDFPRLLREELAQPIRGAACGGTHRLSGLSLTVKARLRRGEPLDGEYQRAAEFVKKYQMYAFRLQNRDGSLSTSWFRGSGDDDDINRRIKTTGHILEWLCYSLNDDQLREPQTIRAVTYLANLMYNNYDNQWEVGPMCHATHALLLYDERVFQPHDKEGEVAVYRPTPSKSVAKKNLNQGGTIRR